MFVADLANQIPNPLPVPIGWEVQPRNALHIMSGDEQESQVFQTLLIFMQSAISFMHGVEENLQISKSGVAYVIHTQDFDILVLSILFPTTRFTSNFKASKVLSRKFHSLPFW
jgi:hypothetical protein